MKLQVLLCFLCLGSSLAQQPFVGFGATFSNRFTLLSAHAGLEIFPEVNARFGIDSMFFVNEISAELLYRPGVDGAYIYLGPGIQAGLGGLGDAWIGARLTAGLEFQIESFGFFGEIQPYITTLPDLQGLRFRTGVNYYLE